MWWMNFDFKMWLTIGETVIDSLWIGLIFWIINGLLLYFIPRNKPNTRYWVTVGSVILFFATVCQILLMSYRESSISDTNTSFDEWDVNQYWNVIVYHVSSTYDNSYSANLVFSWLWFLGLLLMTGRFMIAALYTYWVGYHARQVEDPFMTETLTILKTNLGITDEVSLRYSEQVSAIFTYGFIKPVIIWPVAMLNNLDEDETTMILAHELMHIGRKDYVVKVVISLINTVLYYHPFIWWANRVIDSEREFACDLGAIRVCSTQTQYARTLIKLQELKLNLLATTANGFSDNNNFSNRIKRLFNMPVQNKSPKARLTILLFLLTTAGLFAYAYQKNPDSENIDTEVVSSAQATDSPTEELVLVRQMVSRDTTPEKIMTKTTQVITKIEGDQMTTIKMEDGKVVDVQVNGEKVDPSEFDKYTKDEENRTVIRKRRGADVQEFELDIDERMESMPFLKLKKHFDEMGEGKMKAFEFSMEDMPGLDSLFTRGFKNFNFNFNHDGLDSMIRGNMKIFGFGEDGSGFPIEMDSMMKSFEFDIRGMGDDPIVIRKSPRKGEARPDRREIEKSFEFVKPEKMNLTQVMEKQLKKDGLLRTGKLNKIELNQKQLKINGEKMPEVIFEKYRDLYEKETGLSLSKGNNVIFEVNHQEKNSKEYKTF